MPYVCLFTLSSQLLTTLKDDFDREPLLRGQRISLARIDAHTSWVSNHVLQLVAPPPEHVDGRLIIRDKHGKPTGAFLFFGSTVFDVKPLSETFMASQRYSLIMLWISFPRNPSARPTQWSISPALLVMPSLWV